MPIINDNSAEGLTSFIAKDPVLVDKCFAAIFVREKKRGKILKESKRRSCKEIFLKSVDVCRFNFIV